MDDDGVGEGSQSGQELGRDALTEISTALTVVAVEVTGEEISGKSISSTGGGIIMTVAVI